LHTSFFITFAHKRKIMRIDIITVLPEMFTGLVDCSILKRAQNKNLVEIVLHNLRDYTTNKHRNVDDYPFGGEAGMVLQIEPIDNAISSLKLQREYDEIIYTSPDGEVFNQGIANQMSSYENIIILCGHYKGIDYRVREHLITREISIGDYVLTGGELAAAVMTDAIVRLIPGAIGDEQSALSDSFQDNLLAPPVYTRPAEYKSWRVPDILLSGHQAKIDDWKLQQSLERTERLRPDLLDKKD
jgi:tRNA (guanine37-N1)-methyltransferase